MKTPLIAPDRTDESVTVCIRISLDAYARLLLEASGRGVSSGEMIERLLLGGKKRIIN